VVCYTRPRGEAILPWITFRNPEYRCACCGALYVRPTRVLFWTLQLLVDSRNSSGHVGPRNEMHAAGLGLCCIFILWHLVGWFVIFGDGEVRLVSDRFFWWRRRSILKGRSNNSVGLSSLGLGKYNFWRRFVTHEQCRCGGFRPQRQCVRNSGVALWKNGFFFFQGKSHAILRLCHPARNAANQPRTACRCNESSRSVVH
jgi:hypothetical protein